MLYNKPMRLSNLLLLALSATVLSACNWVDSAGGENNTAPVTEIVLEDGQSAGPLPLVEKGTARIFARSSDDDGVVRSWQWSTAPIDEGDLSECTVVPEYDSTIAATSLEAACAPGANCQIQFDLQSDTEGTAEFTMLAPELMAPVGLRYRLTTIDNDGGQSINEHVFCLLAVNDPPEAMDDNFTVLEGQTLIVTAADINLLTNDVDDDDVRNLPLRVDVAASSDPSLSRDFVLQADGGFSYSFIIDNLINDATDSFEYTVTDGENSATATANISIVATNEAPIANGSFSQLEEIAGIDFSFDFTDFFSDPEGSSLGFTVLDGSFPESGEITFSPLGILSGAGAAIDIDEYDFTILVSDGVASTEAEVSLVILDNEDVIGRAIPDVEVVEDTNIIVAVGNSFEDPEEQSLRYTLISDDAEVNLTINSRTGVISGFISDTGEYEVDISASDGFNRATTTTMTFIVESLNDAPIFTGTIADQDVTFGRTITTIRPIFIDPDGDDLTYQLQGITPTGLALSDSGVLSGRPRQTGIFSGLRIIATDPSGLSARSNAFTLTVAR